MPEQPHRRQYILVLVRIGEPNAKPCQCWARDCKLVLHLAGPHGALRRWSPLTRTSAICTGSASSEEPRLHWWQVWETLSLLDSQWIHSLSSRPRPFPPDTARASVAVHGACGLRPNAFRRAVYRRLTTCPSVSMRQVTLALRTSLRPF